MKLLHIEIENFLGAVNVKLHLRKRVNLFAGANAAARLVG